jgi:hypothetical protein
MFPVEEVHKIAILDLRIQNCDRNDENILIKKTPGKFQLLPIDHGLSFPDTFSVIKDEVCWMYWN